MAADTSTEIDVSIYAITAATNGAFGFLETVEAMPDVTGTAKTSEGAVAAARAKLRKRLAAMEAAGTVMPAAPAPMVAPRMLDLLKDADDAAPAEFLEQRRRRAAFAAEFEATSRDM